MRKRRPIVSVSDCERGEAMFRDGATQLEVAKALNCSPTTSWKISKGWRPGRVHRSLRSYILDEGSGCWNFTGYRDRDGYGKLSHNGVQRPAHRLAWCKANHRDLESLSPEDVILHSCDNPTCINPEHLSIGTVQDNTHDRVSRGRGLSGEEHPMAKLSKADVDHIRAQYRTGGPTQKELALRFGITQSSVSSIVIGKVWKETA